MINKGILFYCPAGGDNATNLKLRADAGRLLLLVEVEQRLGDAVVQRHAAQVAEGLDVQQVLRAQQKHTTRSGGATTSLKSVSVSGRALWDAAGGGALTLGRLGLILPVLFLLWQREMRGYWNERK